jgi:tricorn protease
MRDRSYSTGGASTCHLGLEFDPGFAGPGLKVSHVTYRGPADQPGVEIAAGDVVLEIAGTPVSADMRWLGVLDDMSGKPVPLTVADGGETREEVIKATSYGGYQSLLYREWELANEQKVDELSAGRIGYIHIAGMNRREWSKFEREFYSELFDKDAIVIDVRFNGGGWLHEDLFEALDRNVFGMAGPRGAERVVQPAGAFKKPKALLINARSYSDAEIFPAGWRALGLGPIVGIDTGGAVIGTTGFTLIDGSWVRLPVEGWWELDGRNLETSGTPPDYYLDVHPDELKDAYDAQLVKAVELLLAELE